MLRTLRVCLLAALAIFVSWITSGQTIHAEEPPLPRLRLVEAVQLSDFALAIGSDELDLRGAVISPSGLLMAYPTGRRFCIYAFAAQTLDCVPMPDSLTSLAPRLVWSPDERMIAMHEDFHRFLFEPDIWLFDVENRQFIHRTDDDAQGRWSTLQAPLFDWLPTWHPQGDLYFFRTADLQTTELYRIRASELRSSSSPELIPRTMRWLTHPAYGSVYDLGFNGLAGVSAFSPDGTQLALVVRPPQINDPFSGVWIIRPESGTARQVVPRSQLTKGLPAYITDAQFFVVTALSWTSDGELIISAELPAPGPENPLFSMLYRVSIRTGELTPLIDFSDVPDVESLVEIPEGGTSRLFDQPLAPVIVRRPLAEGQTIMQEVLLTFNREIPSSRSGLTIFVLPTGEQVGRDGIPYDRPRPSFIYSAGTDGSIVRAIMFGYLLTLEWEG